MSASAGIVNTNEVPSRSNAVRGNRRDVTQAIRIDRFKVTLVRIGGVAAPVDRYLLPNVSRGGGCSRSAPRWWPAELMAPTSVSRPEEPRP